MPKKKEETTEEAKQTPPTAEQVQQAAAQALQEYFTPEVNARISEINDDQMFDALRRLEDSEFWFPMLRYINKRLLVAQSVINQLDPVQQPTGISRTQGVMSGLTDLQNAVITLVATQQAAAVESERIRNEFAV